MLETWGILEILGHRRLAGILSEETIAGAAMVRIDIPKPEGSGFSTQYYASAALYAITPCDEATARAFSQDNQPRPIARWELPPLKDQRTLKPDERGTSVYQKGFFPAAGHLMNADPLREEAMTAEPYDWVDMQEIEDGDPEEVPEL